MAGLNSLKVFSQYAKSTRTEVLQQQVEKFNAASNGTLVLKVKQNDGDYSDESFWKRMEGLVRRRNAYGAGAVTAIDLEQLMETSVKVAAGTPPVNMPPSRMKWILKDPKEQAVIYGQQLAVELLADMVNTAIGSVRAALLNSGLGVYTDGRAAKQSWVALSNATRPFGDRASRIAAWIEHSSPVFDLLEGNLTNAQNLFHWDTVRVLSDALGRTLVVTDSPSLVGAGRIDDGDGSNADGDAGGSVAIPSYYALGLVPGAVIIEDNDDFIQNFDTRNGDENINTTLQSEWSYNVAVKGFAWDKTNGGKSPTTAALTTSTNWDRVATDLKELPGVVLESK